MTDYKPEIGTLISGTLRTEDLHSAFSDELRKILESGTHPGQRHHIAELLTEPVDEETVGWMAETLSDYAPPYCYFGTHEGDGADFGYWPDIEALENDVQCEEVLKVSDLSECEGLPFREIMLVNDHGNVTFGRTNSKGEFTEIWSVV